MSSSSSSSSSSLQHAVAGSLAGGLSLFLTYPLWTITVKKQVVAADNAQHENNDNNNKYNNNNKMLTTTSGVGSSTCSASSTSSTSTSTWSLLQRIVQEEGLSGLFPGVVSGVVANFIQSGVYYYWYNAFHQWHQRQGRLTFSSSSSSSSTAVAASSWLASWLAILLPRSALWHSLFGIEAGVATVLMTNPLWVLNSRAMTSQRAKPTSTPTITTTSSSSSTTAASTTTSTVTTTSTSTSNPRAPSSPFSPSSPPYGLLGQLFVLLQEEGLTGLYAGVVPALALVVNPAIIFFTYRLLEIWLAQFRRHFASIRSNGLVSSNGKLPSASSVSLSSSAAAASSSSLDAFFLGAMAKLLATVLTYPLQTVKMLLQKTNSKQEAEKEEGAEKVKGLSYLTWWQCLLSLASRPDCLKVLYSGLSSKLLQTGLKAALEFYLRAEVLRLML